MMAHLTVPGAIHAALALLGIALGLVQLVRPKRGAGHRARGYAFVYAMLIADGAAMLVFQFTGQFNILHIGAMVNLVSIAFAIIPVLRSPRPANWKRQHYCGMSWSYVGLLAAAATEFVVRTGPLLTKGQAWIVTAAVTSGVTAIGYALIERYRPTSEPPVALNDATIQQGGVPT
jgi:uncharacterized membrane protein